MNKVRIGTRGSILAMWQARAVEKMLVGQHPELEVEVVVVKTLGDNIQDVPLSQLPGKAFFTKEIEDALSEKRIDLAVHSGKDVPTALPDGLVLAGFVKRHRPHDAWICNAGHSPLELPSGSVVGTSSIRRRALVSHLRPDLKILDLRGNVDTRLRKLDNGDYDAIILAAAGLDRLELEGRITQLLSLDDFPPAVCQGAIALEIRETDSDLLALLKPLVDKTTTVAATAERSLLRTLEGGCQVPLGAIAQISGDVLSLRASIVAPDGTLRVDDAIEAPCERAEQAGQELATRLLASGGNQILKEVGRSS
jgi:hydroxymethylbilane synthase